MAKVKSKIIQNGNVNYVYGTLNGIDTTNLLANFSDQENYTAQQDCIVCVGISSASLKEVVITYDNSSNYVSRYKEGWWWFPLKKGHTIHFGVSVISCKVYGIKR